MSAMTFRGQFRTFLGMTFGKDSFYMVIGFNLNRAALRTPSTAALIQRRIHASSQ